MQRLKTSFLDQNSAANGKIEHHIIKRLKQLTPASAGLGFLYNNFLLDCNTMDSHHPHYLRPRNRPASFVAPLFVMHNGRPWLVAGSPGSERILSNVAQFLVHVIEGDLSICESPATG